MSMKNVIAQCIVSGHERGFRHREPNKSIETIMVVLSGSQELFSMFNATCIPVSNTRNQHFRNHYLKLLGNGAFFAPCGKVLICKLRRFDHSI